MPGLSSRGVPPEVLYPCSVGDFWLRKNDWITPVPGGWVKAKSNRAGPPGTPVMVPLPLVDRSTTSAVAVKATKLIARKASRPKNLRGGVVFIVRTRAEGLRRRRQWNDASSQKLPVNVKI